MRDLDDLRAAFAVLEQRADDTSLDLELGLAPELAPELAPDPAPDPAPDRRPARGRRRRTPLAVAAAAVIVAGVAAAVVTLAGTTSPPDHARRIAASPGPAASSTDTGWQQLPTGHYLVVLDRLPGAKITSVIGVGTAKTLIPQFPTDYQEIQVTSALGGLVFKVNPEGGWTPPTGATQTTVDGRPAYYGRFLLHPEIPNHPVPPRVALAWQYAPGSWATVAGSSPDGITLAEAQRVVGLVRIGVGDPIPDKLPQDS